MKDLMKALWVLLAVAGDDKDFLDSEELQAQLDMCEDFLSEEEIIFLSENSVLGSSANTETWAKVIWDRFRHYKQSQNIFWGIVKIIVIRRKQYLCIYTKSIRRKK